MRWEGPIDTTALPPGPDVAVFATDASTAWGGGIVFEGCRRARRWRLAERFRSINWLETVCVVDFVEEFGPQLRNRRVVGYSDSAVAVAAINKGRSTSASLSRLLMRLELACLRYGITLYMLHIPGVDNEIPDALSRGTLASRCTDLSLAPHLMRRFSRLYGPFSADAFASISGCNAQAARYCSSVNQPTRASLADQIVWAYPPQHLIPAFLGIEAAWGYSHLIAALP